MTSTLKTSLYLCVALILLTGCALPNYKKTVENPDTHVDAKEFKYGKFCGAGHPDFPSKPGTSERTQDLMNHWPPVDDIDAACYAHDMCYQETTGSNLICDQALTTIFASSDSFLLENGCRNLMSLIGSVALVKPTGTEKSRSKLMSIANTLVAIPIATLGIALKSKDMDKYGLPRKEGVCFLSHSRMLHSKQIISQFEAGYRDYAKGYKRYSRSTPGKMRISIPMKSKKWRNEYLTFELQKYLNYFGYRSGLSDGIFGKKTEEQLRQYASDNALNSDSIDQNIRHLYDRYDSQGFIERKKFRFKTIAERNRIFGFSN